MASVKINPIIFNLQKCCVCGMNQCDEAVDHSRFSIKQLQSITKQIKQNLPQIDRLKNQVHKKFYQLKIQLNHQITNKENDIVKWLDNFYFKSYGNEITNISLLTDILQSDFNKIPNRKFMKLHKQLRKIKRTQKQRSKFDTSWVKDQIDQYLKKINIDNLLKAINKEFLNNQDIIKSNPPNKLSKSVKSMSSDTNISNSSQKKLDLGVETYEWKYIRFTKNTKTVELNNRNINDEDMIKQLPIISTFTNIKEFQIRNNKITALTCNLISNQMKFINTLDLRGNKVGDAGVSKVVLGLPNLKALYVSETGITDTTGYLIAANLLDLQTFWSQYTKLSGECALKISQKTKLRLLSLLGNPITQEQKQKIKTVFRVKGYLNI